MWRRTALAVLCVVVVGVIIVLHYGGKMRRYVESEAAEVVGAVHFGVNQASPEYILDDRLVRTDRTARSHLLSIEFAAFGQRWDNTERLADGVIRNEWKQVAIGQGELELPDYRWAASDVLPFQGNPKVIDISGAAWLAAPLHIDDIPHYPRALVLGERSFGYDRVSFRGIRHSDRSSQRTLSVLYGLASNVPHESRDHPQAGSRDRQPNGGETKYPSRYGEPPFVRRFLEALPFVPTGLGFILLGAVRLYEGRDRLGITCLGAGFLAFFIGVAIILLTINPETWEWWI